MKYQNLVNALEELDEAWEAFYVAESHCSDWKSADGTEEFEKRSRTRSRAQAVVNQAEEDVVKAFRREFNIPGPAQI